MPSQRRPATNAQPESGKGDGQNYTTGDLEKPSRSSRRESSPQSLSNASNHLATEPHARARGMFRDTGLCFPGTPSFFCRCVFLPSLVTVFPHAPQPLMTCVFALLPLFLRP